MITATFTDEIENITSNTHLYQWDKGQKLTIEGVTLSDTPVVHFANKKSDKALVINPELSPNKLIADIPNSLLQEPYPIIAYIYAYDDNEGKTIKTVYIPVESRTKPDDYVFEGDTGFITLAEMNSKLDAMIRQSTNDFNALLVQCESDYNSFKNTKDKEIDDAIADAEQRYQSTISQLETGFAEVEELAGQMETSLNNMETSVSGMETSVGEMQTSISDIQSLVNNMIVTGSYTGTGTYGVNNKNSITFDKLPKLVKIYMSTTSSITQNIYEGTLFVTENYAHKVKYTSSSIELYKMNMSISGNTISWWDTLGGTSNGAMYQLNKKDQVYRYVAFY